MPVAARRRPSSGWRVLPPLLVAACLLGATPAPPPLRGRGTRGTHLLGDGPDEATSRFDRRQSAGLFIGIGTFTHDESLDEVPFAVDDAIDLAYLFALDSKTRLIEPAHVVLALSGEPRKDSSRRHLEALLGAGATRRTADQADLPDLLERQTRTAGPDGMLVLSFAGHGFTDDNGVSYLAAASTLLRFPETAVPTTKVFDIVSRSKASRRIAFLDACRSNLVKGRRATGPDSRSAVPDLLSRAIAHTQGQVIFFAARAGGYAFDDLERRNGVFTDALIDGLRCAAPTDDRGFVTVNTLAA